MSIHLERINDLEYVDGLEFTKLMMSFILLTSVIGKFVQINICNQSGVEAGKKILKEELTK